LQRYPRLSGLSIHASTYGKNQIAYYRAYAA